MARGKKEPVYDFPIFDESVTYYVPMITKGDKSRYKVETIVPCKLTNQIKDKSIVLEAEGYENKYFYSVYFDWLLYRRYAKCELYYNGGNK